MADIAQHSVANDEAVSFIQGVERHPATPDGLGPGPGPARASLHHSNLSAEMLFAMTECLRNAENGAVRGFDSRFLA